jgi:AAA domain
MQRAGLKSVPSPYAASVLGMVLQGPAKSACRKLSGAIFRFLNHPSSPYVRIFLPMPTAHLISGLPCSGKTTYAKALRETTNGVLFSLDYWLITTHGRYSIGTVGHEEHVRRVLACRHLISGVSSEFLQRGTDVILDDGFFLREHRIRQIALFGALSANKGPRVQVRRTSFMFRRRPYALV